MARKTSADFLAQAKASAKAEPIDLPGMTVKAFARPLSAAESNAISDACMLDGKSASDGEDAFDSVKLTLHITAASVVDEKGERLVPAGREDEMRELPARILNAMQAAALKANGMGGSDDPGN